MDTGLYTPAVSIHDIDVLLGDGPETSLQSARVSVYVPEDYAWAGKRAFDIFLASVVILLTLPLLLLVAIAIKLSSDGPVFFRHKRVGHRGQEFEMLKFRTMQEDAEERLYSEKVLLERYLEADHKIPDRLDPRISRIGKILRRSSLDELPQLFNVLSGKMSLVGPRPVEQAQLAQYQHLQRAYLGLRPGVTGLWQVSGRSTVKFPLRAVLDDQYRQGCSLLMDLAILARTPLAVLRGLNAD